MGWPCRDRIYKALESLCSVKERTEVGPDSRMTKQ